MIEAQYPIQLVAGFTGLSEHVIRIPLIDRTWGEHQCYGVCVLKPTWRVAKAVAG